MKAESPPRPTSDVYTKSEIEQYFEYHFHKDRVFASPGDKKHPGSIPDYHISSTVLVSTLSNLSTAALKHFQDEYLDDVFVYIDRLEEFKEFADVALRFPKIGGRIKLDSRNVYEPEKRKMPQGLDAERGKKQLAEKVGRLEVWKKEVRRVVELIGEEMGLDEDAFKVRHFPILPPIFLFALLTIFQEKLASITPLPAKENEPLVKVGNAHINPVAADLKVLGYKQGGWSVNISCSSVHADEDKQKFQLWGDIGGVGGLWKYYEAQKEDAAVEVEVKKAQKEDATVEVDVEEAAKENGSS